MKIKMVENHCTDCQHVWESEYYEEKCPKCNGIFIKSTKCIECVCGNDIWCEGFTNTCDCGRDYNWSGDMLAPRSQWGEETSESVSDILSIDSTSTDDLLED